MKHLTTYNMKLTALPILLAAMLLASCESPKKFVYMQDMNVETEYPYFNKHEAVVHADDRLDITVSSKSPELAVPFNANGGAIQVNNGGDVNATAVQKRGYRVDKDGYINFPILGRLHVEGLKTSEVTEMIRKKIIDGNYIKDPLVDMEYLNFKYTVLGAAGASVYPVDGDRITLLEAIAKAGDVAPNGKVEKVDVIREENGKRIRYTHDLRSKDVFDSPCYYLQQNDIVYIEPKYRNMEKKAEIIQYTTLGLSAVATATSILWLAIRR